MVCDSWAYRLPDWLSVTLDYAIILGLYRRFFSRKHSLCQTFKLHFCLLWSASASEYGVYVCIPATLKQYSCQRCPSWVKWGRKEYLLDLCALLGIPELWPFRSWWQLNCSKECLWDTNGHDCISILNYSFHLCFFLLVMLLELWSNLSPAPQMTGILLHLLFFLLWMFYCIFILL